MSHPVLWPRAFFYPVANASAICLTDSIPPENSANVLLLGCGDPRNILYTLHADPPIQRPALDVTCCDIEPAVIARNVLLFTLIHDGLQSTRIWDIFYHMKVDQDSFALIISQSKKLLQLSKNLDTWRTSCYSSFLQFCSTYTLSRVRHYLELYAQAESYSRAKHEHLFSSFTREFEFRDHDQTIFSADTARSAGPFLMDVIKILNEHFRHYWKTGTVSRSTADITAACFINPTFVHSESSTPSLVGNRCATHYGTYPFQGFHLASAFLTSPSSSTDEAMEALLVSCAQSQFREWCSTFQATTSTQGTVIIRLLVADALAFCHTLCQFRGTAAYLDRLYVSPWSAAELVLDGDVSTAPTNFDMIDTSNLADHVGLLNVLVAAVPLLSHCSTSVLYTEIRVEKGSGSKASNFEELLCADIPTTAVLLGISPTGSISRFTSTSKVHEIVMTDAYRERIAWKLPYISGEPVTPSFSNPPALAAVLFGIYKQMFADEDMAQILSGTLIRQDIVHYNRGSFAALLGLVKSRVRSDWTTVMDLIFDQLHADRSRILGSNNYQELCCQLYLRDVYCPEALGPRRATITPTDRGVGLFKGWKEVPPVVCLVLVIPRERIRLLEGETGRRLGSPMFQCEVRGRTFHNIFSCIQAILGTASIQGSGSNAQVSITENAAGWSGSSALVVSVFVPAFNLVYDSGSTKISLGLHPTPITSRLLDDTLGPMLVLFTADVMDRSAVYVTMNRPNRSSSTIISTSTAPITPTPSSTYVSVGITGSTVSTLTARWETTAGELKVGLNGVKVDYKQIYPSVIQVGVNDSVRKDLVYPFPVDGTRAKIRIARKSGWIEVEAPVRLDSASPLVDFTVTSVSVQDRRPIVWNIHRVNFSSLPVIQGTTCLDRFSSKIQFNCSFAFSDREWSDHQSTAKPILVSVKETITSLFKRIIEPSGPPVMLLRDSLAENGGIYTAFYCNEIRLDPASHTFVVDACILPLTTALIKGPLGLKIGALFLGASIIETRGEEVEAWKHLLVAFTERCRSWSHTSTCKYSTSSKVPASVEIFENPLCGCGQGIELGRLSLESTWKKIAPFMTRAAVSPLFALAYLETVDKRLKTGVADPVTKSKKCAACNKPELDAKLLKCSRCKEVDYCGKDCQAGHWKEHKTVCKAK
ncbi:hypothetical protein DFH09DRAFT_1204932 [Mycena vulgaris]|nr:hypothetical protein DFH09DRAFT_1204932 [Mycena vulgaris]